MFNKKSLFLEVLIILHCLPVASPSETVFAEKTTAEVAAIYLVFILALAVEIWLAGSGFDDSLAVAQCLGVGIVERIDVDGHAHAVLRHFAGVGYEAEVE